MWLSITCISSSGSPDCSDVSLLVSNCIFSRNNFWHFPLMIENDFPQLFYKLSFLSWYILHPASCLEISSPERIICRGSWISRSDSYISFWSYDAFNIASGFLEVTATASKSSTCCLDFRILTLVVLHSLTLRACWSSISWLCFGSGITVNILVCSYVLMS